MTEEEERDIIEAFVQKAAQLREEREGKPIVGAYAFNLAATEAFNDGSRKRQAEDDKEAGACTATPTKRVVVPQFPTTPRGKAQNEAVEPSPGSDSEVLSEIGDEEMSALEASVTATLEQHHCFTTGEVRTAAAAILQLAASAATSGHSATTPNQSTTAPTSTPPSFATMTSVILPAIPNGRNNITRAPVAAPDWDTIRRTGTGPRPWRCVWVPGCTYAATRKDHLKRHFRTVHIGLRPFVCACGYATNRLDNLRAHEKIKGGRPEHYDEYAPVRKDQRKVSPTVEAPPVAPTADNSTPIKDEPSSPLGGPELGI